MEAKTTEYYLSKIQGTRKEKLKRIIKKDPQLKLLKKDLKEGFESLVDKSYEIFMESEEEKEPYKTVNETYRYIAKSFKGGIFKTKSCLIFGT